VLSESELAAWYRQRDLSERAQQLLNRIRSSDAARRVGGGRSNVSGSYPSRNGRVDPV
jgi:hypothetical protein